MTAALEGNEWSAAQPGRTLPPGKSRYPFYRRLGGPQGRSGRAENLVPTGIRFRTVQPVVSRYTDWANRPKFSKNTSIYFSGILGIARSKRDGTRAETRFGLPAKRTSPFKSAGVSFQSTIDSRGVRISGQRLYRPCSDVQSKTAGYPLPSYFPLHFPSRASPRAIRFQTRYTIQSLHRDNYNKRKSSRLHGFEISKLTT